MNSSLLPSDAPCTVYGFGKTGQAIVRFLIARGHPVTLVDDDPRLPERFAASPLAGSTCRLVAAPSTADWEQLLTPELRVFASPGIVLSREWFARIEAAGAQFVPELDLAQALWPGPIVAITGSNGKSTITAWVHHCLTTAAVPAVLAGNIGVPLFDTIDQGTPDTWGVWEVSSYQLEHTREFHPRIGIISNLTPDHLQHHGSFEAYANAKLKMCQHQVAGEVAIRNHDDPLLLPELQRVILTHPITSTIRAFSRRGVADAYETDGELRLLTSGGTQTICKSEELLVPGGHNIENALAVLLAGAAAGLTPTQLREGLTTFHGLAHRLEHIPTTDGLRWINDSKATNTESTLVAIAATPPPYLLVIGGSEKDLDYSALYDALEATAPEQVITMGPVGDRIAAELEARGSRIPLSRTATLTEAVAEARRIGKPGWTILLSPGAPSFNEFQNFEHRGEIFRALVTA